MSRVTIRYTLFYIRILQIRRPRLSGGSLKSSCIIARETIPIVCSRSYWWLFAAATRTKSRANNNDNNGHAIITRRAEVVRSFGSDSRRRVALHTDPVLPWGLLKRGDSPHQRGPGAGSEQVDSVVRASFVLSSLRTGVRSARLFISWSFVRECAFSWYSQTHRSIRSSFKML